MKQSQNIKIKEIDLKPGNICYVTNQALEQMVKSSLWNSKEDLLNFIEGFSNHREKTNIYDIFKEYPGDVAINLSRHHRIILITDFFDYSKNNPSLKEKFVVIGFLHKERTYYTYFHSYYKEFLNEYLTKLL